MIPGFEIISRNKVAKDILREPLWYAEILLKRVQRLLVEVTPARLGVGAHYFDLPLPGGLLIPLLIVLALVRKWPYIKLILFTLPLAASALLIYSGKGMTYYSVFVQFMAAVSCVAILSSIVWASRLLRAERRAPALIDGNVEPG